MKLLSEGASTGGCCGPVNGMDGMIAMVGLQSRVPALVGHPREAVKKEPTNAAGTQIDKV
jgi:hypothetical protein